MTFKEQCLVKKFVALLIFLSCFAGSLFPAENEHSFLVVPRVEANPYIGSDLGIDFGNTSLYTLFEGNFGEHFSYSVLNHWLSTEPATLYQNTGRSDDANWVDVASLTFSLEGFSLTAGKQCLLLGSFDQDNYDYDMTYNLSSTVWNNLYTYNWGLAVGYDTPDESTSLALQWTVSPFGEYNNSGLFTYSLYWMGEYGLYSPIWSLNLLEYKDPLSQALADNMYVFASGNRFTFGRVELTLDWISRSYEAKKILSEETTLMAAVKYSFSDKMDVTLKGGWESNRSGEDVFGYEEEPWFVPTSLAQMEHDYFFGGVLANYYPLEQLRIHGALAANNYAQGISLNVGATYFLDLFDLF